MTETRPRNELWDALLEIFEYEPLTGSETKLWGKIIKSLKDAGATRESMIYVAKEFRKEFPSASLTPTALEKHYSRYAGRFKKKKKVVLCEDCGIGNGLHLTDCPQVEARAAARASTSSESQSPITRSKKGGDYATA